MTTIRARAIGKICNLEVSGHAEFNPGNDVVCAGISAICYALVGYLANHTDSNAVFKQRIGSGYVDLSFSADDGGLGAWESAVIGLAQIAKKYPENVEIKYSAR